ncbi:hypothetical protein WH50_01005 [Pokkaliibacter plantistimulans]|uniref:O-antigen ligase-related domain-containing protein n=1 Tax=Pokkaliibacter plantistimulans TaxID=1635171 RepID=A0ABX5M3N9_9GAMM|nr:O-antigen ligase family protein [Pokkaliibacter plantistimulans]PXF33121.1 hypothetical protein WH50_01005 [Pokkaliibacter plantistimulans]
MHDASLNQPKSLIKATFIGMWALFIHLASFFSSAPTSIKEIAASVLMLSGIYCAYHRPDTLIKTIKTPLFFGYAVFLFTLLYSVFISQNPYKSWSEVSSLLIFKLFLTPLAIAIIMQTRKMSGFVLCSLAFALVATQIGDLLQYFLEWLLPDQYPVSDAYAHRARADGLVILLPFGLLLWPQTSTIYKRILLTVILILCIALLIGTNTRGAMLAAAFIGLLWLTLCLKRHEQALFLALAGVAILATFTFAPSSILSHLTLTTSNGRAGDGVWGAAIELIKANPWLGYGYGQYTTAYNSALPSHPEWIFQSAMGPHNLLLGQWAEGGVLLLLGTLLFCLLMMWYPLTTAFRLEKNSIDQSLLLALWLSFTGQNLVRGIVEMPEFNFWGVLVGVTLGVLIQQRKSQSIMKE